MKVQDIMTKDPACCPVDAGLREVAKMMVDNDCGAIPVVENSESKKPVGVVTDRDIACRAVAQGKNPLDLTARDVMTDSVITVKPDTTIEECGNLMERNQIRRIVVVDESGACCGMVAQADIAVNASGQTTADIVQEVSKGASNT